jgi:hypothetical protein
VAPDFSWRATFYTTGMEHSPTSATWHRMGAHAVARDAAGGVGGAHDGGGRAITRIVWVPQTLAMEDLKDPMRGLLDQIQQFRSSNRDLDTN